MSENSIGCSSIFRIASGVLTPRPEYRGKKTLPQNDMIRFFRSMNLLRKQEKYEWTTNGGISETPMVVGLPQPEERIRLPWILEIFNVLNKINRKNEVLKLEQGGMDIDDRLISNELLDCQEMIVADLARSYDGPDLTYHVNRVAKALLAVKLPGEGTILQEYKDLFQVIRLPKIAKFENFLTDEIFAWYRVAGPNPMRLKLLSDTSKDFPELTDKIFNGIKLFEKDLLNTAASENRLYYIEYPEFKEVRTKPGRFLSDPKAIFAIPKGSNYGQQLMPVAIRCGSDSKYNLCTANNSHTDPVSWMAAKISVQSADAIDHEVVQHLSRTHLLCGIIACATHRNLSVRHPIFDLLHSHCYGTAFINWLAGNILVNEGGILDPITAPVIEETNKLAAKAISSDDYSFNDWAPDVDLEKRQVMSPTLHFPYRDDALRIWSATLSWVQAYINSFYATDDDVRNDFEVQNWAKEISIEGRIPDFGDEEKGVINSKTYLVRSIATFIFAASSQHAATNFAQAPLMSYAPVMPLCLYSPPPDEKIKYRSIDEVITKMLPPINEANQQLDLTVILSDVNFSKLGQYKNLNIQNAEVKAALETFQNQLEVIEESIKTRNKLETENNLPIYRFLRPSEIPESINI